MQGPLKSLGGPLGAPLGKPPLRTPVGGPPLGALRGGPPLGAPVGGPLLGPPRGGPPLGAPVGGPPLGAPLMELLFGYFVCGLRVDRQMHRRIHSEEDLLLQRQ